LSFYTLTGITILLVLDIQLMVDIISIDETNMKYTIIIEKSNESGYVSYAPALKCSVLQGMTKAEATRNIKEAIEVYIEALIEEVSRL
jgi:predicted RNase H-like HicB family nuclease